MTTSHPLALLSAYLDGELAPAERSAVEAHLADCPGCRAHISELRATAALIASLPDLVPSRRLVPRLASVPAWLAPLRTLATLASGVSVFLFMASAILANIGWLSQGAATDSARSGAAAVPAAGAPAASVLPTTQARDTAAQASPAAKQATSSPGAFAAVTASPSALGAAPANAASAERADTRIRLGPSPWLWLVLAIVLGAIALALQRRLRSV